MKHAEIDVASVAKSFAAASPFKHVSIPEFLAPNDFKRVFEAVSTQDFAHRITDLYSFWQTADFKENKDSLIKEVRDFLRNEVVKVISEITGFALALGVVDVHGTIYKDTDHLLCHDDQLEGRKVAFMLYLSSLSAGEGGALELYLSEDGEPTKVAKRIVPAANTLLIFEVSPLSFHAVSELVVDKNRIALAGWFHGH